jgi:4-oxalocrotonate tautomerase
LEEVSLHEVVELPVVQVSVWAGMSEENKKKVVEGITRVLEELGIPREAVTVIIYEVPKTNWATGGQLHSESRRIGGPHSKDISP